ncbi:zinc finger BED domain-containing protein RICESLEEPER 2-like [Cucumis melo var. makuwa]|uniref:Zinc finger BED domain-containing protein RICESLEEPER 2-like n=1 Tax=Cucumis melo var. makuwa TaxID=1194695 RepID=A0A5D3B920_CUCMM|nr:zinc finger BED domain-containing protein RICESLEEPER 2-like [Cucumis melo var. makuwa]
MPMSDVGGCIMMVCLKYSKLVTMDTVSDTAESQLSNFMEEKEDSDFVEYFEEDDRENKRMGPPSASDWLAEINKIQFVLKKWSNNNNSVLSLMAMNMKTNFDKYWGSLEKMNKLMFVAMLRAYLCRLYDFYKAQHNPSTQIGHSMNDLKQSNNVTIEVENDEEIDPWITFCALREQSSLTTRDVPTKSLDCMCSRRRQFMGKGRGKLANDKK